MCRGTTVTPGRGMRACVQARRATIPLLDEDTWSFPGAVMCPFFGACLFVQVAFGFTTPIVGSVRSSATGCVWVWGGAQRLTLHGSAQFAWGELAVYGGSLASMFCYFRAPRTAPPTGRVMVVGRPAPVGCNRYTTRLTVVTSVCGGRGSGMDFLCVRHGRCVDHHACKRSRCVRPRDPHAAACLTCYFVWLQLVCYCPLVSSWASAIRSLV